MLKKTKYSFFHKPSEKDNIPFQLPNLTINDRKIKREESKKIIGVLLDENATWKKHLKFVENKCAKNIGLLFKAKYHLNKKFLLALYYPYVHTYINMGQHTFYKFHSKQKHAIHIIRNNAKFEHTRHLFRKNEILNVYQLNILNNIMFMHKISTKTVPPVFHSHFQSPSHSHSTNFSESNYSLPVRNVRESKFRISIRRPLFWSNFLTKSEKSSETTFLFRFYLDSNLCLYPVLWYIYR